MQTRRRFLSVIASPLLSTPLFATTSSTTKESTSQSLQRHALRAFSPLRDDPHILTAIAIAKNKTNVSAPASWQELLTMCSGCKHTDRPSVILAGFMEKKNIALIDFKATNVGGYMLTNEELILGQLLITT